MLQKLPDLVAHMNTSLSLQEVAAHAAHFTHEHIASVVRITDGSINDTYEITTSENTRFILQRMGTLFSPSVMDNLAAVTPYMRAAEVVVPEGLPTLDGNAHISDAGGCWYRALSYIPGKTIHNGITVVGARSAGKLVGRFHSALVSCDTPLTEAIRHFHDTKHYLARMNDVAAQNTDQKKRETLMPLVNEINRRNGLLQTDVSVLPQRIIHADLKISNVRFDESGEEAIALIDMDTIMYGSVVTEMGDALRSWCGTAGEDSKEQVFDEAICRAALEGYMKTATAITQEEIEAIPDGIGLLTLELASRFVADAFEESYFAPSSRYESLYIQNKTRAENQLRFLDAYEAKRHLL